MMPHGVLALHRGTFRPGFRSLQTLAVTLGLLVLAGSGARADRIVLAPGGLIASPSSAKIEYAGMASRPHSNIGWVTVGVPDEGLGLELEGEHDDFAGWRRNTFSAQYSLTGNALSDLAPAVSVGLRDALNQGREGRAAYVAMTKTMGLSAAQERLVRDWKLTAGFGSSHMDGVYGGVQAKFCAGFTLSAEYLARRFNASVSWPLVHNLALRAYTLDGDVFYGASFSMVR